MYWKSKFIVTDTFLKMKNIDAMSSIKVAMQWLQIYSTNAVFKGNLLFINFSKNHLSVQFLKTILKKVDFLLNLKARA